MAHFRRDIEGLRAVAVAAVVLQHTFDVPRGGWVGVDVFFVISGYLITAGFIRSLARDGRLDYAGFVVRRARRLLPAAVLVVLVTSVAATLVWFRPRAVGAGLDAIASLLSVQNWHLIASGTSYFQAGGPTSPLQHYWSLSVEEQFYVVWPLLVVVAARLLGGRIGLANSVLATTGMITVCSIAWAVLRADAGTTYFDPIARAWELSAGAAVAAVASAPRRRRRTVFWWFGLVAVLVSILVGPASTSSPFPTVLPAVVGAVVLVWAGGGVDERTKVVLTNRPVRAIGRLSYSLYLWHLPVILFAEALLPHGWWTGAAAILVTVALAWGTHRWVERRWIDPTPCRRPSRRRRLSRPLARAAAAGLIPLVVAASVAQSEIGAATDPTEAAARIGLLEPRTSATPASPSAVAAGLREPPSRAQVDEALDADFTNQFAPEMSSDSGCRNELNTPLRRARTCEYGRADVPRTALVIGDSVAMSWLPAVRRGLVPHGWRVRGLGFASCAPADAGVSTSRDADDLCRDARLRLLDEVRTTRPDLVVIANDDNAFLRSVGSDLDAAATSWVGSTERLIDDVLSASDRVVFLGAPPIGPAPQACATRLREAAACDGTITPASDALVAATARAVAAEPRASVVDVRPWFCVDGVCPAFSGGVLVRVDDRHLTNAASERLGWVVADALLG